MKTAFEFIDASRRSSLASHRLSGCHLWFGPCRRAIPTSNSRSFIEAKIPLDDLIGSCWSFSDVSALNYSLFSSSFPISITPIDCKALVLVSYSSASLRKGRRLWTKREGLCGCLLRLLRRERADKGSGCRFGSSGCRVRLAQKQKIVVRLVIEEAGICLPFFFIFGFLFCKSSTISLKTSTFFIFPFFIFLHCVVWVEKGWENIIHPKSVFVLANTWRQG